MEKHWQTIKKYKNVRIEKSKKHAFKIKIYCKINEKKKNESKQEFLFGTEQYKISRMKMDLHTEKPIKTQH